MPCGGYEQAKRREGRYRAELAQRVYERQLDVENRPAGVQDAGARVCHCAYLEPA